MKTIIEIADALLKRAQSVAQKRTVTFWALIGGLRLLLERKQAPARKLPPLVTVRGSGLTKEFRNASWHKIRDEIYGGQDA
jgi:hypothetical protein